MVKKSNYDPNFTIEIPWETGKTIAKKLGLSWQKILQGEEESITFERAILSLALWTAKGLPDGFKFKDE